MRTSENASSGWSNPLRRAGVGLALGAAACAAIVGLSSSCSLIVQTSADQCEKVSECATFPGLRRCESNVCVALVEAPACQTNADCEAYADAECASAVCVRTSCKEDADCGTKDVKCTAGKCVPPAVTPAGCATNAECVTQGKGELCRKDTKTCVSLKSAQCDVVHPAGPISDDAFLFGSILPTAGSDASTGLPIQNSIKLAVDDFNQVNGLPPAPGSTKNRPLAFVGCNDNSDSETAVAAAHHLVDDVGVPAIIGAAFSGISIKVTTVTIPAKVMLFSPSATSVAITNLDPSSPRLLWRTSPADSFQAQALSFYMADIEAKVREDAGLGASDKINVAVVFKGDAYGKGLADALAKKLKFNGGASDPSDAAHYYSEDYGNPDDPSTDPPHYPDTVTHVLGKAPHVVFIFGTNEGVTEVFAKIEENWPAAISYRPRYIFGDGGEVNDLWTYSKMTDALRQRISGTVPGTTSDLYNSFITSYKSKFGSSPDPNVFGTAGGYDIVHMLAFSAVSQGAKPLTGENLASGMAALVPPGEAVSAGSPADIGHAFSLLMKAAEGAGSPKNVVDYAGASGPLDFDLAHGEAPSDIQIWCMPAGVSSPAGAGKYSGYSYDAKADKMTGTLNWGCQ